MESVSFLAKFSLFQLFYQISRFHFFHHCGEWNRSRYFSAFPEYGVGHPFMFTTFTFLLLLFFLFPKLIHNFYFWTPLVGYYWIFLIDSWLICQNHDILWGYWLLVILTNCLVPQERKTKFLSLNASLLIAFVFLFSIIHKAISPDFLSGNILYYQLLFSTRFYFLDAIFPFNYLDILESNLIKLLNLQENFVPFNFKFIRLNSEQNKNKTKYTI